MGGDGTHFFTAVAFEENLSLRELQAALPGSRLTSRELHSPLPEGGHLFAYPFGAVVFVDVPTERRDAELVRVHRARPGLTTQVVRESFTVRVAPGAKIESVEDGLLLDELTPARMAVVALIVAQSAAMEYYERIVDALFGRVDAAVRPLERSGTVSARTGPMHRLIGEAIATRNEVVIVLALLDKPDATWDDPQMDRIYDDLRAQFDLADRYGALEAKLRAVQDSLELIIDVARDRRMVLLEIIIVVLFVLELGLTLWRR